MRDREVQFAHCFWGILFPWYNTCMVFQIIYDLVSEIPSGKVLTYGRIARIMGMKDVRKVGFALHANRDTGKVPCHRVVKSDGTLASGYAFGGWHVQKELLTAEGVPFVADNQVNIEKALWEVPNDLSKQIAKKFQEYKKGGQ
jgi:methylated-DNA-protein-cysteine methyltransferase related protein